MSVSDPVTTYIHACHALHNSENRQQQQQANLWLIQFEKERAAWQVADQVLHKEKLDTQAYFHAVNTLLKKLHFHFDELTDASQRAAFKQSLLTHAVRFSAAGKEMRLMKDKLSQCVAVLAVHLIGMNEWPNAIGELVEHFSTQPSTAALLLDILTYLPNENHYSNLYITKQARAMAQRLMMKDCARIIDLLMQFLASTTRTPQGQDYVNSGILKTPNVGTNSVLLEKATGPMKEMHSRILQTFLAWVKYSNDTYILWAKDVPPPQTDSVLSSERLIDHPLLLFCFKIIASRDAELEQTAIDVICSLLQNFNIVNQSKGDGFQWASGREEEDGENREEGEVEEDDRWGGSSFGPASGTPREQPVVNPFKHLYFMRFMLSRVMELVPLFERLPEPASPFIDDEDDTTAIAGWYGRLFTVLAEYYLEFIYYFCLGVEGFNQQTDPTTLQHLYQLGVAHRQLLAQATQSQQPAFGERDLSELILSNRQYALQIVEVAIKCVVSHRREINMLSTRFFFLLSERLDAPAQYPRRTPNSSPTNAQGQQQGSTGLSPLQMKEEKRKLFKPIYLSLIPPLHRLATLPSEWAPPGEKTALNQLQLEEVSHMRKQAGGALGYVTKVHGGAEQVFEVFTGDAVMGAQIQSFLRDKAQWRPLEASLFCLRELGYDVLHEWDQANRHIPSAQAYAQLGRINTEYLPKVFDFLLSPATGAPILQNQAMKYTTLKLLQQYAFWMKQHGKERQRAQEAGRPVSGNDYLPLALSVIVDSLSDAKVCSAATRALKRVCEKECERIAMSVTPSFIDPLMSVYSQCLSQQVGGMTLDDKARVIQGVGAVVSCIGPPSGGNARPEEILQTKERLYKYLHQLVLPMVTSIQQILTAAQQLKPTTNSAGITVIPLPQDASKLLSDHLWCLGEAAAVKPDSDNHALFSPCMLQLYQQHLSPVLYTLMQHFADDERRMDKTCRVAKHVIQTTKLEFMSTCLEPLLRNLAQAFQRQPHACFLYLFGHQCVDVFSVHPDFKPILLQLLPAFFSSTIRSIPHTEAMIADPDMAEDFFDACIMVLRKCPEIFFGLEILPQIVETAIHGLHLHHRNSFSCVCLFFSRLFENGVDSPQASERRLDTPFVPEHAVIVKQAVQRYGPAIIEQLVLGIVGAIPSRAIGSYQELFYYLIENAREQAMPWLKAALLKVPDTADPTKQEFFDACFARDYERMKEVTYWWSAAARQRQEIATSQKLTA